MYDAQTVRTLCRRVNRVKGHLDSVKKMLGENRLPDEVLQQLRAAEGSLHKLIYKHFDPHVRLHLFQRLNIVSAQEGLSLQSAQYLASVKKEYPSYSLRRIPKIFYEMKEMLRKISL